MHQIFSIQVSKWPKLIFHGLTRLLVLKSGRLPFSWPYSANTTHFFLQTPNPLPLASMTNWPNTRCLQGRGGCQENPMKRCWMYSAQRKVRVEQNLNTAGRCCVPKEGVYEDVKWMWEVFGWKPGSRHLGLGTLFSNFVFIQQSHVFPFEI